MGPASVTEPGLKPDGGYRRRRVLIENRETTRGRQGSSPGPNPTEFDLLSCDLTLLDPKQPRVYHLVALVSTSTSDTHVRGNHLA